MEVIFDDCSVLLLTRFCEMIASIMTWRYELSPIG